jgi:hypothetical protein
MSKSLSEPRVCVAAVDLIASLEIRRNLTLGASRRRAVEVSAV